MVVKMVKKIVGKNKPFFYFQSLFLFILLILVSIRIAKNEAINQAILAHEIQIKTPLNAEISGVGENSFTVKWTTNVATVGKILLEDYEGRRAVVAADTAPVTDHKLEVKNLADQTLYSFYILSDSEKFTYGQRTSRGVSQTRFIASSILPWEDKTKVKLLSFTVATEPVLPPDARPLTTYEEYKAENGELYTDLNIEQIVTKDGSVVTPQSLTAVENTQLQSLSQQNLTLLKDIEIKLELRSPIIVIIESKLFPGLWRLDGTGPLNKWMKRRAAQGHDTVIWKYTSGKPGTIREQLKRFYQKHPDTYAAWLIGNIPAAFARKESGHKKARDYPSDLFYGQLFCEWVDQDKNGVYDYKTPSKECLTLDIPVGRLYPKTLTSFADQLTLLKQYFSKLESRERNLNSNNKISHLSHATEEDEVWWGVVPMNDKLNELFPSKLTAINTYNLPPQPEKALEVFRKHIREVADLVRIVSAHAWVDGFGFDHQLPGSIVKHWAEYFPQNAFSDNLQNLITLVRSCGVGSYIDKNYYSGAEIFGKGNVLGSLSSVDITYADGGTVRREIPFIKALITNGSVRDAIKAYFNSDALISRCDPGDSFIHCGAEKVYLGDPTVHILPATKPGEQCQSAEGSCTSSGQCLAGERDYEPIAGGTGGNFDCGKDMVCCKKKESTSAPPSPVPGSTGERCHYQDKSYQHGFCTPTSTANLWLYCDNGKWIKTETDSVICPKPYKSSIASCIGNNFALVDAGYECCSGIVTNGVCGSSGGAAPPEQPSPFPPESGSKKEPDYQPPSACGKTCVYSEIDSKTGDVNCYEGNCKDSSQNCSFNKNCGWVANCSTAKKVTCPKEGPSCGGPCIYSQLDADGQVRCYMGNCKDSSQNCSFNKNCGWVAGCSAGTQLPCPSL